MLKAESEIETHPVAVPMEALDITISEARQIYRSQQLRLYDFLHASRGVQLGRIDPRGAEPRHGIKELRLSKAPGRKVFGS